MFTTAPYTKNVQCVLTPFPFSALQAILLGLKPFGEHTTSEGVLLFSTATFIDFFSS